MSDLDLTTLLDQLSDPKGDNCQFPNCTKRARHTHHVTYKPAVTTRLCEQHHKDITVVNSNRAFKRNRKLTNRERLRYWCDWIEGKAKPHLTPEASKWIESW